MHQLQSIEVAIQTAPPCRVESLKYDIQTTDGTRIMLFDKWEDTK